MIIGEMIRDNLIIGGFPTITREIELSYPCEFKRGDVVGKTTDGSIILVDSTKTDGSESVYGIMCDDISVSDDEIKKAVIYVKGAFNQRYLNFGGSDNIDKHKDYMMKVGLLTDETRI